jgi:hypothetical protein
MIAILFLIPSALGFIGYGVAQMAGLGLLGTIVATGFFAIFGLLMLLGD